MLHDNINVQNGHLTFAGADTVALAKEYGTPLMLLDEERIRQRIRMYKREMTRLFGQDSGPLFAGKSLCFKGIYRLAREEDIRIDIVSPGELFTAYEAGFPMERAFFHGNNKTDRDVAFAMEHRIGYFVADSREELEAISAEASRRGITQKILLRITPGIDPHTHAAITTGKVDSKFGAPIETGQAEELVAYALSLEGVALEGLHCHIGSQIFEAEPFCRTAEIMVRFLAMIRSKYRCALPLLNLGGGFGVRYVESDPIPDYPALLEAVAGCVHKTAEACKTPMPTVLMEPGRSLVADAGMTLYEVGTVKTIPGYKSYVSVDGGMADNPRYALYGSAYTFYLANRPCDPCDLVCTVAGRCCESGDLVGEGVSLPHPKRGEILAVAVTGAYNYAMASNYNRLPRPAVLWVRDGRATVAVRRETYADLIRLDE